MAKMIQRICIKCGVNFSAESYRVNKGLAKYCSASCHNIDQGKKINRNCLICKNEFSFPPSQLFRNPKYCSLKCYGLSERGKVGVFKGKKLSPEHIANIVKNRPSQKGKKLRIETIKKISEALKGRIAPNKGKSSTYIGEKHWNWKGGITSKDKLERIKFFKYTQKKVLERDDYTCQLCGIKGVVMHVDHIQSWAKYIDLRFDINNCRTLCMQCHYFVTFNKPMPKKIKSWGFNKQNMRGGLQS